MTIYLGGWMMERRGSVYNMDREKKAGRGVQFSYRRYIIREKRNWLKWMNS
jgi:hypothetical protein